MHYLSSLDLNYDTIAEFNVDLKADCGIIIIIIITVFIQRLTHRRLVYNGITHV